MFQIFSERMRAELEAPAARPVSGGDGAAAAGFAAPSGSGVGAGTGTSVARAAPAQPEALDAAALGARVARRSASRLVKQPTFWAVLLIVAAGLTYFLLQRSSSAP